MDLKFRCPTRVFLGQGCIERYASEMAVLGSKALIVIGASSAKRSGALQDMVSALKKLGIDYLIFDRVEQNPSIKTVYEGGEQAREWQADFIIGIGGGSPLDAAKAIAVLAVNRVEAEELMAKKWGNRPLPVVAVPTTAGTGSEVTPYAILTVDWAETKMSIAADSLFPVVAFLDGSYTLNLPGELTANTAVDALTHSIEGYINRRADRLSDLLALESIGILGRLLRKTNPSVLTLQEREELLYASMLAGIVIAQTATGVIHALGYPLTYFKNLPHGLANGVITRASLEFMAQSDKKRVQNVVNVMGCADLAEVGELLNSVLTPVDFKLTSEEVEKFITKTLQAKNIANCPCQPTREDIRKILVESNLA